MHRRSDARVILGVQLTGGPGIPGVARVGKHGGVGGPDGDAALALDELEGQALGRMPGDVAVHQPGARVVELEGEGEVAVARQGGDVAARRVDVVEGAVCAVECGRGLRQDPEVVAVQVDGVEDASDECSAGAERGRGGCKIPKSALVLDDKDGPLGSFGSVLLACYSRCSTTGIGSYERMRGGTPTSTATTL
jgi:hypothetical protein